EALAAIGEWMTLHHGSVQGAGPVDPALGVETPPGAILTQKGARLFIHLATWPMRPLHVRGLAGKVRFAPLLHDRAEVTHTTIDPQETGSHTHVRGTVQEVVRYSLPITRPAVLLPVLEVRLDENGTAPPTGPGSADTTAIDIQE